MISHREPVVMIGSCFTDNIGACLREDLFDVTVNPLGPLYNPASVEHAVQIPPTAVPLNHATSFTMRGVTTASSSTRVIPAPTGMRLPGS